MNTKIKQELEILSVYLQNKETQGFAFYGFKLYIN